MSDTNDTGSNNDSIPAAADTGSNDAVNTSASSTPAQEGATAAPAETATSEPAAATVPEVTITVTGQIRQTMKVPAGTPLNVAFKNAGVTGYSSMSFRDSAGQPVGQSQKIVKDMTISSVNHTSGG